MKNKLYYQFAGSCSLLLFAFLSYVVKFYPSWFQSFDSFFATLLYEMRPHLNGFFLWITQFANPVPLTILVVAVLVVLLYGKQYTEAIWLSMGVIGISGILNPLFKLFFMRERPALEHLVSEHSLSFPSGHAAASMVFYGSLILLVPIFIEAKALRWLAQAILVFLVLAIGFSRVYLGVHFPTDIIGGYTLSLSWLLLTFPIYQEQRFIWRFKNKQH